MLLPENEVAFIVMSNHLGVKVLPTSDNSADAVKVIIPILG
jgi:hypothetical protein